MWFPLTATALSLALALSIAPRVVDGEALRRPLPVLASAVLGAAASGLVAWGLLDRLSGEHWWWLPAVSVWSTTLALAAVCDSLTKRIPTPLVRSGGLCVLLLVALATIATGDWRALVVTGLATLTLSLLAHAAWRWAGLGYGDVRLATVGGLLLGHVTARGVAVGLLLLGALTAAQAAVQFARTRDRKSHVPYGPGLALGLIAAAAL